MKQDPFVLDNSVLSAFYRRDWLTAVEVHHPENEITVPDLVWNDEFSEEHELTRAFDWIDIQSTDRVPYTNTSKSLSDPDLACLGLAERLDGTVVANDRRLIEAARARQTSCHWGTAFLLETFEQCGISQAEFDSEKQEYTDDVYLPQRSKEQLFAAKKP